MTRGDRGPGFAPYPRYPVYRATDLVVPTVAVAEVHEALVARGIAVVDREVPVGRRVLAVVSDTAAGTVITLQRRGDLRNPRSTVRRRLGAILEILVDELENAPRDSPNSGRNRTKRRSPGS